MRIKLTLDRFEGDFGVCFDTDGKKYDVPKSVLANLDENDIFLAFFDGKTFSDIEILKEETEQKRLKMKQRLNNLFNKSKK